MKKLFIIFVLLLGLKISVDAQKNTEYVNITTSGTTELSENMRYAFPQFTHGTVYFKNNSTAQALLNYNYVSQTLQFKDKEEILDLQNPGDVSSVKIGTTMFIPINNSFAQVIKAGQVSLLLNRKILMESVKRDGYGTKMNTASAENASTIQAQSSDGQGGSHISTSISTNTSFSDANFSKEYEVKQMDRFYLFKFGKTYVTTKKNFIKCFPDKKDIIEKYVKEHAPNFDNEEDMIKLLDVCNAK